MKSKKIAYFISSKTIGATYHLTQLAKELQTNGNNYYTYITDTNEQMDNLLNDLSATGAAVKKIENLEQSSGRLSASFKCIKTIIHLKPDIIHSQSNHHLLISVLTKPFTKNKIIHTVHSFNNGRGGLKMFLNKVYLNVICKLFADRVVAPSRFVYDSFPSLKNKIKIIPLGYSSNKKNIEIKKTTQTTSIIYCAKYHPAKNHTWLVKSLWDELKEGNIRLIMPGDGNEFSAIKNLISKDKNVSANVEMPGWVAQNEINTFYAMADIAVVPSNSETFGHNIIEPLSYSVPVISFPVGIANDIKDGFAVSCIDFFDKESLIEKINKHRVDIQYHNQSKEKSLIMFDEKFSWISHINSYEKLIEEC